MQITPTRYYIKTEISEDCTCGFTYELLNQYYTDSARLTFSEYTTLNKIAKCVTECFKSEELRPSTISFKFHENEVELYKGNFTEISESQVLEGIAEQIK